MLTVKSDVQDSAGALQTCSGQEAGIEAAIHAMHDIYQLQETEAVMLVDASNAFNCLNRSAALHNINYICPELSRYVNNTYQKPSKLYINGGNGSYIMSSEGTTQGDNAAMAMYAVCTKPLIDKLGNDDLYTDDAKVSQVWFADDSSAAGTLNSIMVRWVKLVEEGPKYGYFPHPSKCVIIVKDQQTKERAEELIGRYGVEVTCSGQRHLGAIIGSQQYKKEYVTNHRHEPELFNNLIIYVYIVYIATCLAIVYF